MWDSPGGGEAGETPSAEPHEPGASQGAGYDESRGDATRGDDDATRDTEEVISDGHHSWVSADEPLEVDNADVDLTARRLSDRLPSVRLDDDDEETAPIDLFGDEVPVGGGGELLQIDDTQFMRQDFIAGEPAGDPELAALAEEAKPESGETAVYQEAPPPRPLSIAEALTTTQHFRQRVLDETSDDIFQIFFQKSMLAQYVLDLKTRRFLAVNAAFETLTGYGFTEITEQRLTPETFVVEELADQTRDAGGDAEHGVTRHFHIRNRVGDLVTCEVNVRRAVWRGRDVALATARDVTKIEAERRRLANERDRFLRQVGTVSDDLVRANQRLAQLTERLMRAPDFTRELERYTSVSDTLQGAVKFLSLSQGMEFKAASIHRFDRTHMHLRRVAATLDAPEPAMFPVDEHDPFARVALGLDPYFIDANGTVSVPLRVKGTIDGVLNVLFHALTWELIAGDTYTTTKMRDLVVTLADLVGLRIDNLELLERIRRQTVIDQLTGAYNRRYFDRKLKEEFARATRYARELSLIVIDLDDFKKINETFTFKHQQGDKLLQEIVALLKNHTRATDSVCRTGGDEFAIILPETPRASAATKAEQIRAKVADTHFTNLDAKGDPVTLTLSLGVAATASGPKDHDALYTRADDAAFDSKGAGKNRVSVR